MTDAERGETLEAGRELDARVAEQVMGIVWQGSGRCPVCGFRLAASPDDGCVEGSCSMRPVPDWRADEPRRYSSDIAAAWEVVEALRRDDWLVVVKEMPNGGRFLLGDEWTRDPSVAVRAVCELSCVRHHFGKEPMRWAHPFAMAQSVPLAICRAALAALQAAPHTPTSAVRRTDTLTPETHDA